MAHFGGINKVGHFIYHTRVEQFTITSETNQTVTLYLTF